MQQPWWSLCSLSVLVADNFLYVRSSIVQVIFCAWKSLIWTTVQVVNCYKFNYCDLNS